MKTIQEITKNSDMEKEAKNLRRMIGWLAERLIEECASSPGTYGICLWPSDLAKAQVVLDILSSRIRSIVVHGQYLLQCAGSLTVKFELRVRSYPAKKDMVINDSRGQPLFSLGHHMDCSVACLPNEDQLPLLLKYCGVKPILPGGMLFIHEFLETFEGTIWFVEPDGSAIMTEE